MNAAFARCFVATATLKPQSCTNANLHLAARRYARSTDQMAFSQNTPYSPCWMYVCGICGQPYVGSVREPSSNIKMSRIMSKTPRVCKRNCEAGRGFSPCTRVDGEVPCTGVETQARELRAHQVGNTPEELAGRVSVNRWRGRDCSNLTLAVLTDSKSSDSTPSHCRFRTVGRACRMLHEGLHLGLKLNLAHATTTQPCAAAATSVTRSNGFRRTTRCAYARARHDK